MSDRFVRLERWEQSRVTVPNKGNGFRVRIIAKDAVGMPTEIFGYLRSVIDPEANTYSEDYKFFCGPWDLVTFPVGTPNEDQSPPYFRKSICDVILPSESLAEEFWEEMKAERDNLIAALNAMDTLQLLEDYPPE